MVIVNFFIDQIVLMLIKSFLTLLAELGNKMVKFSKRALKCVLSPLDKLSRVILSKNGLKMGVFSDEDDFFRNTMKYALSVR
jgi:hypothetical protein